MARTPQSSTARGADPASAPAAVRLLDEHDHCVVVLKLDAVSHETQTPPESAGVTTLRLPRRRGRATRALALALIGLGTLALADAAVTVVWQEPLSALYTRLRQDHLGGVLRKEEHALPTPAERRALASLTSPQARIAFLAASLQRRAHDGAPVGRIRIPRIGQSVVIVNGTSTSALQSGPGIYPETVFPGAGGTTAIAGHRTTYLAPFRHIDELRRGNRIMLDMPYARLTYTVTGSAVVAPTDVRAAVDDVGYQRLVLSACTPLFSAAKRILVFARLQRAVPVQAAQAIPRSRSAHRATRARSLTSGARTRARSPHPRSRSAARARVSPPRPLRPS
jgi:sortase A